MKNVSKKLLFLIAIVLVLACSCQININKDDDDSADFEEFFNYPDGRKDPTGLLKITNSINSPVLLFTSDLTAANYIGTVGSLDSINVKLPEEKFYTIIAVDKSLYKERGEQAERFSDLTYYSRKQPYSMTVNPGSTYGGGKWIINNPSNYWVSFMKSDGSGEAYAVAAPHTTRVTVPIQFNKSYDFVPHFYKEIKYNGNVIALSEYDDQRGADTIQVTSQKPQAITDVNSFTPPSNKIKPAILITNSCDKAVRVFHGQNNQLNNGSQNIEEFVLMSGNTEMFVGIEPGINLKDIQFSSIAWDQRVYATTENITLENNKVYKINLSGNINNTGSAISQKYSTTVSVEDGDTFYE